MLLLALYGVVSGILPFEGQDRLHERLEPKAQSYLVRSLKPFQKLLAKWISDAKAHIPPAVLYTALVLFLLSLVVISLWNIRGRRLLLPK
jgi:hypothetical protein